MKPSLYLAQNLREWVNPIAMSKKVHFLVVCTALLISCNKDRDEGSTPCDYLIVGLAGNFKPTPKLRYYYLSSTTFKKDTSVTDLTIPKHDSGFKFNVTLSDSLRNALADITGSVPNALIRKNQQTIGEVLIDAGYYDVRTRINGTEYKWRLEADQNNSNRAVKDFYAKLGRIIGL